MQQSDPRPRCVHTNTNRADGEGNSKLVEGRTADLLGARIVTTMFVNGNPQTAIELIEGVTKHRCAP